MVLKNWGEVDHAGRSKRSLLTIILIPFQGGGPGFSSLEILIQACPVPCPRRPEREAGPIGNRRGEFNVFGCIKTKRAYLSAESGHGLAGGGFLKPKLVPLRFMVNGLENFPLDRFVRVTLPQEGPEVQPLRLGHTEFQKSIRRQTQPVAQGAKRITD